MRIANVIHEKELINHTKVDYVNYIDKPTAYEDVDKSLPTLYVGWSFMKACNPDNPVIQNADILKKKIVTNELYWEFNFQESKASHVKGVNKFTGLAPEFYFKPRHTYTNLCPVFFQLRDVRDLMDVCPKKIDCIYNYKNEMVYLLSDNKIYGLNLEMYRFFKFNVDKLIMEFENHNHIDDDGSTYEKYYRIFPNFELLKRYLVTML